MPNWCTNYMIIQGDPALISKLAEKVIKPNPQHPEKWIFDFNGILPMPDSLHLPEGAESSTFLAFNRLDKQLPLCKLEGNLCDWLVNLLKQNTADKLDWKTGTVAELKSLLIADWALAKSCHIDYQLGAKLLDNIRRYGYPTWYGWCDDNWGTKWNSVDSIIYYSTYCLEVTFDTAWAPPKGIYRAICAAYPALDLKALYIEEGMAFAGEFYNDSSTLIDKPCSDEQYRAFALENFSIEDEDDEA